MVAIIATTEVRLLKALVMMSFYKRYKKIISGISIVLGGIIGFWLSQLIDGDAPYQPQYYITDARFVQQPAQEVLAQFEINEDGLIIDGPRAAPDEPIDVTLLLTNEAIAEMFAELVVKKRHKYSRGLLTPEGVISRLDPALPVTIGIWAKEEGAFKEGMKHFKPIFSRLKLTLPMKFTLLDSPTFLDVEGASNSIYQIAFGSAEYRRYVYRETISSVGIELREDDYSNEDFESTCSSFSFDLIVNLDAKSDSNVFINGDYVLQTMDPTYQDPCIARNLMLAIGVGRLGFDNDEVISSVWHPKAIYKMPTDLDVMFFGDFICA